MMRGNFLIDEMEINIDAKEYIESIVIKHLDSNTVDSLFELLSDSDVSRFAGAINFGWPDFLCPYVDQFESDIIKMLAHTDCVSYSDFMKALRYYDDLYRICTKLSLPASYGKLRCSVFDNLHLLESQLMELFKSLDYGRYERKDVAWDIYNSDIPF